METIYLAGYHGVGKTIVGKLLSSRKDLKFLDLDLHIEEKENKSIDEIINLNGLEYYHNLGKYVLKNSIEQGMIVSLTVDAVKDEENIKLIKTSGRVIYLRAKADTIYENLKDEYSKRFDLKNNFSILSIDNELKKTKAHYEELANYVIDIDNKKLNDVFKETLAIYNYANKVKCNIYIK